MLPVLLFLTLAGAATVADAQSEPQSGQQPNPTRLLETVTVEAAKLPSEGSDLASRVSVIDADRISAEVAQDISDLVRYEPGVDVANQGSRFGNAGFNIRGVGGNRVQIEVDGVAVSDAFSIGSFSNAGRDLVDVDSLKQVEIIRGPASATFGSNALGGVVSFVTRQPHDYLADKDRHFDISAGFNTVDRSSVTRGVAAADFGSIAAMVNFTARSGNELDTPLADPLEQRSLNLLTKLVFGEPDAGGLQVSLERFAAEQVTDVDSLETRQDFSALFGVPYFVDTDLLSGNDQRDRTRLSVGQEWTGGAAGNDYLRWRAYAQTSATTQDTFESRTTTVAGVPRAVERRRVFDFEQDLAGLEINAARNADFAGIEHQFSYGVEYEQANTKQLRDGQETDLSSGTTSSQVGPDLYPLRDFPVSRTSRTGVYLQDRIQIGAVTLVPGVRWDRFTVSPNADNIFTVANPGIAPVDLDESRVSPKFGALWDIGDHWQLYGQYAQGFRAPPVNDVNVGFTNLQFGYTTLPNPDLKAESSEGLELGLRFHGRATDLELAAFVTRYDDFIASFEQVGFDPVTQVLQFQSINLQEVEIRGAELEASFYPAALPAGMSLHASAALAIGENRITGNPINSVAPFNAVFGVHYQSPDQRWSGRFLTRGASRQDRVDTSAGELLNPAGFVVHDLVGHFRPTANTRIRGGIYNLTDRDYTAWLDVAGVPAMTADPQRFARPGRHLSLAIDWNF